MISVNAFSWLLALCPVLLILVLMTKFHWGGSKAGVFTWLVTQIIAIVFFGATITLLQYTYLKSFFLALDVLLIIWGAMFQYQVTRRAGTIQVIGNFLANFTGNKAFLGIFLGWLFPSFLQGMGGFGVPAAVSAPLLVSSGFSPILAVLIVSIGHGWGVTYGSMGSSVQSLMAVTGLPADYFASPTGILLGISAFSCGLLVLLLSGKKRDILSALPLMLLSSTILAVGQYILANSDLWVIAVSLPALVSLGVGFFYLINVTSFSKEYLANLNKEERGKILTAFLPYIILLTLIVFSNFFTPLREILEPLKISILLPEITTTFGFVTQAESSKAINPFLHPGTIIIISALISFGFLKRKKYLENVKLGDIVKDSFNSTLNTSIAIFALVGIAVVMNHVQMTSILALGVSEVLDQATYPLVSPFIGALGAFITGSNSNSNVLFGNLQMQTADLLNLSIPLILAAQTTGGALGSIMAPAKVILGCSTVGLSGDEGRVIGKLILYCGALILLISIMTFLFSRVLLW